MHIEIYQNMYESHTRGHTDAYDSNNWLYKYGNILADTYIQIDTYGYIRVDVSKRIQPSRYIHPDKRIRIHAYGCIHADTSIRIWTYIAKPRTAHSKGTQQRTHKN